MKQEKLFRNISMKILTFILVSLGFSFSSITVAQTLSQGCSIISTGVTFLKNDEYKLLLQVPNEEGDGHNSVIRKKYPIGRNKIVAAVLLDKSQWKETVVGFELSDHQRTRVELLTFELDLRPNFVYYLVAAKRKDKGDKISFFDIKLRKKVAHNCSLNDSTLPTEIPAKLQYRLDLVMKDINQYFQKQGMADNEITIEQPKRLTQKFGIVVGTEYKKELGINILAITPSSIASQIGLLSGDYIVSINNISLTNLEEENPNATLKENINKLSLNQDVTMGIIRNGESKTLTVQFQDFLLPPYSIKFKVH